MKSTTTTREEEKINEENEIRKKAQDSSINLLKELRANYNNSFEKDLDLVEITNVKKYFEIFKNKKQMSNSQNFLAVAGAVIFANFGLDFLKDMTDYVVVSGLISGLFMYINHNKINTNKYIKSFSNDINKEEIDYLEKAIFGKNENINLKNIKIAYSAIFAMFSVLFLSTYFNLFDLKKEIVIFAMFLSISISFLPIFHSKK